jgi:hypothetical protein
MPIQVDGVLLHAMSDSELSRVRTELDPLCIFPTVPPHPVHPNRESSGHGHLGDVSLPAHRQMHVPSFPVRIPTCCGLCCFSQQETQQRAALLGDSAAPSNCVQLHPSSGGAGEQGGSTMSKYERLQNWLRNQSGDPVFVLFDDIEDEDRIGVKLPLTARQHREW